MDKHPTEYTSQERAAIYARLLREELSKIKRVSGAAQVWAAKGRATKRFNALGL